MEQETKIALTGKEITERLSNGKWHSHFDPDIARIQINSGFEKVAAIDISTIENLRAETICNAVNNTYLKGYDPVYFEEVVKRLKENQRWLEMLINATPTSELRNILTAGNIATLDTLNKVIIK